MPGYSAVDHDEMEAKIRPVAVAPAPRLGAAGSISFRAVGIALFFCMNIKVVLCTWLVMLDDHNRCGTVGSGISVAVGLVVIDMLVPFLAIYFGERSILGVNMLFIPMVMTFQIVVTASSSKPGCDGDTRRFALGLNVFSVLFHALLLWATARISQSTIACPSTIAEHII